MKSRKGKKDGCSARDDHTPVLVDYDGMCVPNLISDPPKPCFEFGLKGYVHPCRDTESLSLNLDHFPAWVILIALRASAADPGLFQRFVEEPEIENMLFSAADMANPAASKLWPELFKSPDAEVRSWAKDLHVCLDRPFVLIPPFQTDPFSSLVELCAAPESDWEAIQIEAERITSGGKPLPLSLSLPIRTKVETAKKKIASRAALRTQVESKIARRAEVRGDLPSQLVQERLVVPIHVADEALQHLAIDVVPVGDRFRILAGDIREKSLQVRVAVNFALGARQRGQERLRERFESLCDAGESLGPTSLSVNSSCAGSGLRFE